MHVQFYNFLQTDFTNILCLEQKNILILPKIFLSILINKQKIYYYIL